jgi:hypothetical protein
MMHNKLGAPVSYPALTGLGMTGANLYPRGIIVEPNNSIFAEFVRVKDEISPSFIRRPVRINNIRTVWEPQKVKHEE